MQYKDLVAPEKACEDKHCPYHGDLRIHGRSFEGVVTSSKVFRTVTVSWERIRKLEKYERFIRNKTKVLAHNPDCINAKLGDKVVIYETRPISRWKRFVVVAKE